MNLAAPTGAAFRGRRAGRLRLRAAAGAGRAGAGRRARRGAPAWSSSAPGRAARIRGVRELPGLLRAGDLLVFNDARVRPARLFGRSAERRRGGAAAAAASSAARRWECLVRPAKRLRAGADGALCRTDVVAVVARAPGRTGAYAVRASTPPSTSPALLERARRDAAAAVHPARRTGRCRCDRERYQTSSRAATAPSPRRRPGCISPRRCSRRCAAAGVGHGDADPARRAGDVPAGARDDRRTARRWRPSGRDPGRDGRGDRAHARQRAAGSSPSARRRRARWSRRRAAGGGPRGRRRPGPTRSSCRASASASSTRCSPTSTCRARRC